jgi:hypothetical protein
MEWASPRHFILGERSMKRLAFGLAAVAAIVVLHAGSGHATTNADASACHHGLDADRGRVAGISDPAKKQQAYGHLKTAYTDELANNYAGCLAELKAAEALTQ